MADEPWVAAEQDIRDFPTVELRRTGVNRCGEQSVLETVAQCRSFIREGTGDESDDGIRKDGGWQFATAEDVVADGNFPCDEVLADAMVYALVVAAEQDDVLFELHFVGYVLI